MVNSIRVLHSQQNEPIWIKYNSDQVEILTLLVTAVIWYQQLCFEIIDYSGHINTGKLIRCVVMMRSYFYSIFLLSITTHKSFPSFQNVVYATWNQGGISTTLALEINVFPNHTILFFSMQISISYWLSLKGHEVSLEISTWVIVYQRFRLILTNGLTQQQTLKQYMP